MRKLLLALTLFLLSATLSLAADFGDLAGTYSGNTTSMTGIKTCSRMMR